MIDTIKIYTLINKDIYNKINNSSIVKSSINKRTGEINYEINTSSLIGSYSNSINIRTGNGLVYGFSDSYYLSVEGSFHKLVNGYNSHNGYYNLQEIVNFFISALEYDFKIKLPTIDNWFLQRIDIAIVFNLNSNSNVRQYINNLSQCNFPRRNNLKHYHDESIYCSGSTTTLKIYNKLLEFRKHDMKKLFNSNFNIDKYLMEIDGFIRFECEIKKRKLEKIFNKKYILVNDINYEKMKDIWKDEFMKLLKFFESDYKIVRKKEDIEKRLFTLYSPVKARNLYNFYTSIMVDGVYNVKNRTSSSRWYENTKLLKNAGIDYSQKYKITLDNNIIEFNPFDWEEVI